METVRFNIHLYPQWQRIPLILHALPQELFSAVIDAGVSPDSDPDQCCEILAQLVIGQREESLARDFYCCDQKPGEYDEEYAVVLRILAKRRF